MERETLRRIADLLEQRNGIDGEIARLIQRPMTSGHLGQWIAAAIFDIGLEQSASTATFVPVRFKGGRSM